MTKRNFRSPSRYDQDVFGEKLSIKKMREKAIREPGNYKLRKRLAEALLKKGDLHQAIEYFTVLVEAGQADFEVFGKLSEAEYKLGNVQQAEALLIKALERKPDYAEALHGMAYLHHKRRENESALGFVNRACEVQPDSAEFLSLKGIILVALHRHSEAVECYEKGLKISPSYSGLWNNYGNVLNDLGRLDESLIAYERALKAPNSTLLAFSNLITTAHYHPEYKKERLFVMCCEWNKRFAPLERPTRPFSSNKSADKKIRIGMVSDGFRNHPVGSMIISALEEVDKKDFEIYLYATSNHVDHITKRFQDLASLWLPVEHLDHGAFASRVENDQIDILIDLVGHNAGNRMLSMALEPAPLLVKWVGGLINTTGVAAIDYLISDGVETPVNEDDFYVENLIRMPDDYICYSAPSYAPPVGLLPAKESGYITFGCFNNATKINNEVLQNWALLMHEVPGSRLFLKSLQFDSDELSGRVISSLAMHGIESDRVRVEGPSSHSELLASYNFIDISLDPWPYSGGLTTCESLYMGVPVVTLPGPTFAGRHSATHLINAGMPELVVASWEEYRQRVLELASDLDSLATIRQHLRQILLESPVCDARRFARHFTDAMRAIWQRHCEGKAPAALTFNKEGQAWFEGEEQPVEIIYAPDCADKESSFNWQLPGKIITIDNSARLVSNNGLDELLSLNAFGIVAFDPASGIKNPQRFQDSDSVQVFSHAVLGDGEPATLYACLDPAMSGTLMPLPAAEIAQAQQPGCQILTELSINTIALDSIEGLESLDWLILDELSDALTILEHGKKALADTLLVQVRVAFHPTHERQPALGKIQDWLTQNGFQFYRLNDLRHIHTGKAGGGNESFSGTVLASADALFLPDNSRLSCLGDDAKTKLAFLLHSVFGAKDMTFSLLDEIDEELASRYLSAEKRPLGSHARQTSKAAVNVTKARSEAQRTEEEQLRLPDAPHMSKAERSLFQDVLKNAKRYFEFGSGGSTVWAVKMGLTAYGVESDANWVSALKSSLGERCQIEVVDIGPTREWGYPVSLEAAGKFQDYSRAILAHDSPFDLILVDGRFRVACVITAIQHLLSHHVDPNETRIFIHDFWDRPVYHVVLDFLEPIERVDTAGLFKLKKKIKEKELRKVWHDYARQPA
ncbi:tetratricopeptide repeat protein [Billgrantia saliphila]|uniref:O-linked N-acetylglucosamine transferase, SPINDLY family protein n=1 Tax=Billgrantia saliphila TaxID=1848458 RepID=UPI0018CC75BC|nr:glycosyltransferase family 41 protein [Halomonas saliphila]